jgi:hypothetical protein
VSTCQERGDEPWIAKQDNSGLWWVYQAGSNIGLDFRSEVNAKYAADQLSQETIPLAPFQFQYLPKECR